VTRYDPGKAYNVFVLFSGSDDKTHLIDMEGNEVHRWDHRDFPSGMLDPVLASGARGHVIVQLADMSGSETGMIPGIPAIFKNKTIGELDWDGNIVWQWGETAPGDAAQQHHDWARLPNGDTLVLSVLSYQIPGFALPKQLDDAIYEVAPNGEIVWKWIAGDHLDELGFTPEALALVRPLGGQQDRPQAPATDNDDTPPSDIRTLHFAPPCSRFSLNPWRNAAIIGANGPGHPKLRKPTTAPPSAVRGGLALPSIRSPLAATRGASCGHLRPRL
jgi:hypothetical protein